MEIKRVKLEEIYAVMEIIDDAKILLAKSSHQWQEGYPNKDTLLADIKNGNLFGAYVDLTLVGIAAYVKGLNVDYDYIEGKWLSEHDDNDLVVHRIAVKDGYHNQKIGDALMKYAEVYAKDNNLKSIKIDTHVKNIPMQMLCINNGYIDCGIIYIKRKEKDPKRIAYEKLIS